jgi:hypothetical protein
MAQIGLDVFVSGYTGKLLIVWREAVQGNPTPPETGRSAAFNFPYDAVYSIVGINPVTHQIELWRSSDGIALDELIKRWEVDAGKINVAIFKNFEYKVGRGWDNTSPVNTGTEVWADPADTDTVLVDERLDGAVKDDLIIHEAGFGRKLQDEYDLHAGGGIELKYGKTFDQDVAWFITWSKIIEGTATVVTTSLYKEVEEVSADRDVYIDATDNLYNKLVIANCENPVLTLVFPDLSLIPNHTKITINTHNGNQHYVALQFDAGDSVRFLNEDKNIIYLAKDEDISIYFKDGVATIYAYHGKALQRGNVLRDMDTSRAGNSGAYLLADEATGVLDADDYPGLYEWITNLPANHSVALGSSAGQWSQSVVVNPGKINEATTYPYKSKYGIDTVARQFRVPHLKGLSGRMLNAGEYPGRYEHDKVGSFQADMTIRKGYDYTGSPNINDVVGNGDPNHEENKNLTARAFDTDNAESTVKNFGEVPFIIL